MASLVPAPATSAPPPPTTKRYRTLYKKVPGTLYLTPSTLTWNADDRAHEVVRAQQLTRVSGMFQSKAGAARASVKVVFVGNVPVGGLTFVFTGERVRGAAEGAGGGDGATQGGGADEGPDRALRDRAEVVALLTGVIAANNERRAAAAAAGRADPEDAEVPQVQAQMQPASGPGPSAGTSPAASPRAGTPASATSSNPMPNPAKRPRLNPSSSTRAGTPAPGSPGKATTTATAGATPRNVYDLRKAVLLKHPDLKRLYIDVVLKQEGKVLSEEEFWSGRQVRDGRRGRRIVRLSTAR